MAVVPQDATWAQHPKTKQAFILPFGKSQFFVPESAVVSFPKRSNKVADGQTLGTALATKAPEKWFGYCDPDCLMQLRGTEGTSVYTTFEVPGHPEEVRFLRHIGSAIAEKCFKEMAVAITKQIKEKEGPHKNDPSTYNDRQKIRYEVLNWTKAANCPLRAQLHPELNQWTPVSRDGADQVRSCKVDPPSKTRPKGPSDKRTVGDKRKLEDLPMFEDVTMCEPTHPNKKWSITIGLEDPDNPPVLTKMGNYWVLDQYKGHTMTLRAAATGGAHAAAGAAADENDDENDI